MYRSGLRRWLIAGLLVGVALLVGLVMRGPAQASAVVPALDHSRACPGGYTQLTPIAERVTALGTYDYDYIVDGIHQTQHVIPASFKPASATDAQLRSIGFPTRPTDQATPAAKIRWARMAGSFHGTSRAGICSREVRKQPVIATSAQPQSGGSATTYSGYYNWSGVVAHLGAFQEVYGRWTQNYVGNCSCTPPYDESTWIGLGGDGLKPLIQDGTDMTGNTPTAWYEYLKVCGSALCGPNEINQGFIPAGHVVEAYTTADNPYADFQITDSTTGVTQLLVSADLGSAYFDSSTAEWINERPLYTRSNGTHYYEPLANFGQTNWQEAWSLRTNNVGYYFSQANPAAATMVDTNANYTLACTGNTMAYPLNLSTSTFSIKWCKAS